MHLIERAAQRLHQGVTPPPREIIAPEAGGLAPRGEKRRVTMADLERAGLLVTSKTRTRTSEEFRVAFANLARSITEAAPEDRRAARILMVTSARPGEGKSFSALNLAATVALSSRGGVLLVDTDCKQHPLSGAMGLKGVPGFLDLADPSCDPAEFVLPTEIKQLSVLPIGTSPFGAAAMPSSSALEEMITRIAEHVPDHLVILDAAPCLSASDPSALAAAVGQTIMVVEAERTQETELAAAVELVQSCPSVLLLLNKMQAQVSHGFGAYYHLEEAS